jgi:HlyD family secretion protein
MRKLVALGIVIVLGGGGFALSKVVMAKRAAKVAAEKKETVIPVKTVPAAIGAVEAGFALDATVEAVNKVGVYSKMPGKLSRVYYDEGQWVPSGALVAELDRGEIVAQVNLARAGVKAAEIRLAQARKAYQLQAVGTTTGVDTARANLAAARSRLVQAQTGQQLTSDDVATSVSGAEEGVRMAQAHLDALKSGARRQERGMAREQVNQAKANVDTAGRNLERGRKLLAAQAIAQQQFDALQLAYDVAAAQYQAANQQMSLTEEGPRPEEITAAQAQLDQAKAGLAKAKAMQAQVSMRQNDVEAAREQVNEAQAALRMARSQTIRDNITADDISAAGAAVDQARANLQYASAQLGSTYIHAPQAGYVVQRMARSGEYASPGVPIVALVDNRVVKLRCALSEERSRLVAVAQDVSVTLDAIPDQTFTGRVYQIGAAASPSARVFDMEVRLSNPNQVIKSGMYARVTVVTERQSGVIVIPYDSVLKQDDTDIVFVLEGDVAHPRPVQIGLRQANRVAILKGLQPGDNIVVRGQVDLRDGSKVAASQARSEDL